MSKAFNRDNMALNYAIGSIITIMEKAIEKGIVRAEEAQEIVSSPDFIEVKLPEILSQLEARALKEKFTLFWSNGQRQVIDAPNGASFGMAMIKAGYRPSVMQAIDFYSPGDNHDYVWDSVKGTWIKQPNTTEEPK